MRNSSARRLPPIELHTGSDVPAQIARNYLAFFEANRDTWTNNGSEFTNRAGWVVVVQLNNGRGAVNIWAPDKMQTAVPQLPLPEYLKALLEVCNYCLGPAVKPKRLGFAGRACCACHEKLQPTVEYPGWAN